MWHSEMHVGWMMIFWFSFIAAGAVALRYGLGGLGGSGVDSPETILRRRYANGEIDREEFHTRLTDLRD